MLKRLLADVPEDVDETDYRVIGLLGFLRTLLIPWWAPGSRAHWFLRLGGVAEGLAALADLASCVDWGDEPSNGP